MSIVRSTDALVWHKMAGNHGKCEEENLWVTQRSHFLLTLSSSLGCIKDDFMHVFQIIYSYIEGLLRLLWWKWTVFDEHAEPDLSQGAPRLQLLSKRGEKTLVCNSTEPLVFFLVHSS